MKSRMLIGISAIVLTMGLSGCGNDAAGNGAADNTTTTAAATAATTTAEVSSANAPTSAAETPAAAPTAAATVAVTSVTSSPTAGISGSQAQAAALAQAGLNEADVTRIDVRLDRDDGRLIYEVEFYSGNYEYDYDIDADTGEIVSYSMDLLDHTDRNYSIEIAVEEQAAIDLALARVPGATASDIRVRLDYDDGRPVYEGTVVYNEMKYDFEISAADGMLLEWDMESVFDR